MSTSMCCAVGNHLHTDSYVVALHKGISQDVPYLAHRQINLQMVERLSGRELVPDMWKDV
jgi:hypothetical protein